MTERDVSPQRLVHYRSTWYLDAWCHEKDQLLRFALDAVDAASILEKKAREIPVRTIEAELDAGYGIFAGGQAQWATLVFGADAARWVSREEWHPQQKTRWLEDGDFEMQLPYVNETEIVMDLLRHGSQVRVMEPLSLVQAVKTQLERAVGTYTKG